NNSAVAEVGADAVLKSNQNVAVMAPVTEQAQTTSEATIAKPANTGSKLADATAVIVGLYQNTAHAFVDGGAHIDATQKVEVSSSITYPFVFQFQDSNGHFDPATFFGKNAISNLAAFLKGDLGLSGNVVNSFARSVVKNPSGTVSLAGAVTFTDYDNDAEAVIGAGAQINQDAGYQSSSQSVSVTATTTLDLINLAGIFDIDISPEGLVKARRTSDPLAVFQPMGNLSGSGGAGGSFGVLFVT